MNSLNTASFRVLSLAFLVAVLPPAASSAGDEAADSVGVKVIAESGAWPAGEPLDKGLLPIRVRIENHGQRSLKLRYKDLVLVGFSGDRYTALPLHNVLLTGRAPEEKAKVSIDVPKFGQISFRIAPGYSEIFPNTEAFPGHFEDNREYTEYYRRYWDPERKPTLEMFSRLLPEGVLDAGGYVAGFLYFQEVDGWERGLRFEMAVAAVDGEEAFATVNVPVTAAAER